MTYRRDNPIFQRKYIILISLVLVAAFILLHNPTRKIFSRALYKVAPPIWRGGNYVSMRIAGVFANLELKQSLVNENNALREEISRMQAQVLDRNLLSEKVLKLEETLGRSGNDNRVIANVLVGPGRSPYDTLIIDAGAIHGVTLGDLVVYAGGGVIGEIAEVENAFSKTKLFSSPGEEEQILVGPHGIPGVAHGRGGGNFETRLPQGSEVNIGDKVMLSHGSLILGIVGSAEEDPALPYSRILFRTPFNISQIRTVEVILK